MRKNKFFIIVPIAIIALLPLIVMLLWNNIAVSIFAIKSINYIQAAGLFILCRILFGNFGFGNIKNPSFANKEFREKWFSMTREEREQFKEEWRKRKNC